ncbi:UDP-glycosyltransferase UGT5-like [Linepithema humile]|uniref:UDP-glycosyltransferase UGT5-like n=1 Tax=Linepithema humile TaxID=83485 RepID=UPI000623ADEA|nr:PREDICTED: UDP-glucuronosyltransferase 2C1-like [Linepithema humile]
MRILLLIFPWLLCSSICHGYRFLAIFPFNSHSHFMMFEQLVKGLIKKGHQIDVISNFPLKKPYPNYTDIVSFTPPVTLTNSLTYEFLTETLVGISPVFIVAGIAGNDLCKYLALPKIQELVRNPPKDPPYDAVLMEVFGAQCFAVIPHILNIPVIGVSSTVLYPWLYQIIAQPHNVAFVPNNCITGLTGSMNFLERLYNTVNMAYNNLLFNYLTSGQDEILKEHFGPNIPSVRELERKVALILVNSHIAVNIIQPTTPAVVDVGGLHVVDNDLTLPPALEKWMNESRDGFIYLTFGSMVMIETFPLKFLDILYSSLSKIAPVRVLMKVPRPDKLPPGLPKNIYTSPWMPQIKVLKHPNIKGFITHSGLMGMQEALVCGVPMIGIPLFGDQFINIDMFVGKNIAIKLDFHTMTEKDMDEALNAILWNPIYIETARNLSRKFLDRPMSAIDTANYWIKYIVKYGSDALRSPAMDLYWWQIYLLDIAVFFLLCAIIVIIVIRYFVRLLLQMINDNRNSSQTKKTN